MSLAEHQSALAPQGFLRVAINLGNPVLAQGDARSPRGPSLELATALAQRMGVQARFTKDFYVEANATYLSYKKVNYVPFVYSGVDATTVSDNGSKITLDFNIGFRF